MTAGSDSGGLDWARDGAGWPNRPASRFVEANGLRWHVQRMGRGPPLLLVHGAGAATHSWRALMPILAERFDVIAPDLPGHGFTGAPGPQGLSLPGMAKALGGLLEALAVAPRLAVGHSAGAAILARLCIDRSIAPTLLIGLNAALLPFSGLAGHLFPPMAKLLFLNSLAPRLFAWSADREAVARLLRGTGSVVEREGVTLYTRLFGNRAHVAGALGIMANWDLGALARDLPKLGGTGRLVAGLVGLIEGQGGDVRCEADVASIVVKHGAAAGAMLASGDPIAADIVVSNADSAWTYRNLLPGSARRRWSNRKLDRSRYSMGLFVWYFGTRRQYPDVAHHTILMGPRYKDLLADIFQRKILAEDFSLYLHRPTATDPSLAPPGCDTFYVLSPVPNLEGGQDWRVEAEPYRRRIEQALEASVLPGLSREIVTSRVTTPLDFESRLNAFRGAGFGLEPILTQSAWFRPHNRSEDVRNFFLVGAGTHPGAGLPGVLSSAKVLDKVAPHASVFA